jgi:hypothetical protein
MGKHSMLLREKDFMPILLLLAAKYDLESGEIANVLRTDSVCF